MNPNKPPEHLDQPLIPDGPIRVPPAIGLRHLVGVALVTPMLVAVGAFWLHNLPIGTSSQASDSIIEVRLNTEDPVERPQEPSVQHTSQSPTAQPENIVESPVRSIPQNQDPEKSEDISVDQPSVSVKKAEPSQAAAVRKQTDQMALTFQKTLLSHIARYRNYPEKARRNGIHGIVTVLFSMHRDGSLNGVWVRGTSGDSSLDAAAIETIRRAVPLPTIPSNLPDTLNVLIPVAFNLP
jgi:protein TonB